MEDEATLSASLAMAGTLADTASTMLQANFIPASSGVNSSSASGGPGKAGKGSSVGTAVLLLEFSVQLLAHTKQKAAAMEQQQQQQQEAAGAVSAGLSQQVADIQQQVRTYTLARFSSCSSTYRQQPQSELSAYKCRSHDPFLRCPMGCVAMVCLWQVLLQLAQAYLASGQPGSVLDCISTMQGLSKGRTPPAGNLWTQLGFR
jgi:hypothetical protein